MFFIPLPDCITKADKKNANYSLLFNKWVRFNGSFDMPRELKDKKVDEFIRLKTEFDNRKSQLQKIAEFQKSRIFNILSVLKSKGYHCAIIKAKVSDALICGLGDEHTLENSIRLDHCTGLPFFPHRQSKVFLNFSHSLTQKQIKELKIKNL